MPFWMLIRRVIFLLFLVLFCTISTLTHANQTDRYVCVNALSEVQQYVDANRQLAAMRFNTHAISADAYEQKVIEYDDVEASVTMEHCMAGEQAALYQCLIEHQGNYSVCR